MLGSKKKIRWEWFIASVRELMLTSVAQCREPFPAVIILNLPQSLTVLFRVVYSPRSRHATKNFVADVMRVRRSVF